MQSLEAKPVFLNVADLKLRITIEEFERLCQLNRDLRLELSKDGELIVMPPTGGETGKRNINIATDSARFHPQVEIYRLGQEVEVLQSPASLSGEDVLPRFTLDLSSIF